MVYMVGCSWFVMRASPSPGHLILARRFGLVPYLSPTPTSRIAANPVEELKYVLSESVKVPLAFILERE